MALRTQARILAVAIFIIQPSASLIPSLGWFLSVFPLGEWAGSGFECGVLAIFVDDFIKEQIIKKGEDQIR